MGDSKKTKKAIMALAPLWGWPADKDEYKKQWKEFRSNMETYWAQLQDLQETVVEAQKDAWNKIFPKLMDMQDSFASSLPEELPTPPVMPAASMTPKEAMDKVKNFQEKANKHAMEQVDSALEIAKQGQQNVKEAVTNTVDSIEKRLD